MGKHDKNGGEGEKEQKNRRHIKKKDKLVQRKKFKKNKRRFSEARSRLRQVKVDKDYYRKMALFSERFALKVHADELLILKQIVEKLLGHGDECEGQLLELFQSLDEGARVDISGIKDTYLQAKVYKMFKIMRMRRAPDNQLEFRKKADKDIHAFSFRSFIAQVISEAREAIQRGEASSQGEEEPESGSDSAPQSEDENQEVGDRAREAEKPKVGSEFLEDTKLILKREVEGKRDESCQLIAGELESLFGKFDKKQKAYSNLKSKWAKRPRDGSSSSDSEGEVGPAVPDEYKRVKYLGEAPVKLTREQREKRQVEQQRQVDVYNEKHQRTQSLLEAHKEKMEEERAGGKRDRAEFDRSKDLKHFRDKSETIKMLSGGSREHKPFEGRGGEEGPCSLEKRFKGSGRYM
mmetsp:Transcript_10086/g.17013  ORF Transcript_10086/g.17013 Transcript_10086/m.17013 type:complete len:407 (-) Transcript_10086:16-1236(-)